MVDGRQPKSVVPMLLVGVVLPLFIGLMGFYQVTQRSSFEMYRTVDVVQLLGSGVCFGVAMVWTIVTVIRKFGG